MSEEIFLCDKIKEIIKGFEKDFGEWRKLGGKK
jgi:hypothetical protein